MSSSLTIVFLQDTPIEEKKWLTITQVGSSKRKDEANLSDIIRMLARAKAGLSASTYVNAKCPISISNTTITITLGILVQVSQAALEYTLVTTMGTLSKKKYVSPEFAKNIIFRNTSTYQLPYIVEDCVFEWESKCYDSSGHVIATPTVTVDKSIIKLDKVVGFGILRVTGNSVQHQYNIELKFPVDYATRVQFAKVTVVAKYLDENGKEQVVLKDLDLPVCAIDALSVCSTGRIKSQLPAEIVGGDEEKEVLKIFYSTCDGGVVCTLPGKGKVIYD